MKSYEQIREQAARMQTSQFDNELSMLANPNGINRARLIMRIAARYCSNIAAKPGVNPHTLLHQERFQKGILTKLHSTN